jgi:RimJ/RimL family protein N-acetyltransferase
METERLIITEFDESLAASAHRLSVEASSREFIPDEVFETDEDAAECIASLMDAYKGTGGPFVYPVLLKDSRTHIGHVEAASISEGRWEIGYHIGEAWQNVGYATEAVRCFLPHIMRKLNIRRLYGIVRADNLASGKVLEKSGFSLIEESVASYHGKPALIRKYSYSISEEC